MLAIYPAATPPANMEEWGLLALSSFGSFAAFSLLFSPGTQRTSGSHAALIMGAVPLFVSCCRMLLDRRLPRLSWFIGAGIAMAGEVVLVATRNAGTSNGGVTLAGDALVLASCIVFAVGVVAGAHLSSRIDPLAAPCVDRQEFPAWHSHLGR